MKFRRILAAALGLALALSLTGCMNRGSGDLFALPQPPEGFAFPAEIDWNSLPMTFDPAEAMYQVVIPSEDGSQKAVFRCKKWDGSEKGTGMANLDSITFE